MIAAFVAAALSLVGVWGALPPPVLAGGKAEELFQQGLRAYDAREFERAIAAFEGAYRLWPLPEILFDIGMSYRGMGDCRQAAKSFDAIIAAASPKDSLHQRARDRRAELTSCLTSAIEPHVDLTTAAPDPNRERAPSQGVDSSASGLTNQPVSIMAARLQATEAAAGPRRSLWRDACLVSTGSTGVLAAAGLVFGWQARSIQEETEGATRWDDATQRADERGRSLDQTAKVLLVSAGVTVLFSAATCIIAHARH